MTLQEQLDALKAARRSGTKRVRFREREVEYKSDAEMKAAIDDLEREINGAPSVGVIGFSMGDW